MLEHTFTRFFKKSKRIDTFIIAPIRIWFLNTVSMTRQGKSILDAHMHQSSTHKFLQIPSFSSRVIHAISNCLLLIIVGV